MIRYILKRLLALIPVVLGVTFIVFMIMSFAPGDPVKVVLGENATPEAMVAMREQMGLNDPVLVQYVRYIFNVLKGDMGISYKTKQPVSKEVFERFPNTIKLATTAIVITVILAIPLGILAAVKQNTWFDSISMFVALIGVSMPVFWLGLLLMLLFSLKLGWFPSSGAVGIQSLVLPSLSLGFMNMAAIARTTRSSMLEVIRQDYIRTARAKGLSYWTVIWKHAVQNTMVPTLTVIGLRIGMMLGGSVLTETVFAWPGIGRWMIQAINGRDTPTVMGCIILFTVTFSIINLIVDLLYGFVDVRIRSQYS